MNKFISFLSAGIVAVSFASSVQAAESPKHEVFVGGPSGLATNIAGVSGNTGSTVSFGDGFTTIGLSLGYGYSFTDMIELTGRTGFNWLDTDAGTVTIWSLMAGPRFNLGDDFLNAFFAGAEIGFTLASVEGFSNTEFTYLANFGKRFQLGGSHFTYQPELNLVGIGGDTPVFSIVPLAFSYSY